jgi:hypothetical protein
MSRKINPTPFSFLSYWAGSMEERKVQIALASAAVVRLADFERPYKEE